MRYARSRCAEKDHVCIRQRDDSVFQPILFFFTVMLTLCGIILTNDIRPFCRIDDQLIEDRL